jgi:hypothetical protein
MADRLEAAVIGVIGLTGCFIVLCWALWDYLRSRHMTPYGVEDPER